MQVGGPRYGCTRLQVDVVERRVELVLCCRFGLFDDLVLHCEDYLVYEGVVQDKEVEKALCVPLELTIVLLAVQASI